MKANRDFLTPAPPGRPAWINIDGGRVSVLVHVQPGARRAQIVGQHGERLKIAVPAPPLDGRANAAVVELLAERLGVRRSALRVTAGERSRDKRIDIAEGLLAPAQIVERLRP